MVLNSGAYKLISHSTQLDAACVLSPVLLPTARYAACSKQAAERKTHGFYCHGCVSAIELTFTLAQYICWLFNCAISGMLKRK